MKFPFTGLEFAPDNIVIVFIRQFSFFSGCGGEIINDFIDFENHVSKPFLPNSWFSACNHFSLDYFNWKSATKPTNERDVGQ